MNIATGRPVESKGSGFNLEALKLKSKADIEIETMLEENKWFPDAKRWVSYAIKIRKSLVINDRLHLGFSVGEVMESIVDELVDQRMLEAVNKLKTIAEEDKGILETPCGLETSSYFRSMALDFLHVRRKL